MTSGDLMRRLMGQAISLNTHHSSVLFIVDKCNLKHPIRCSSHTTICKTVTAQWRLSVGSVGDLAAVCFLSKNSASGSKTASRQEEEGGGGLEVIEDLQHSGQRPGLGLTAERAVLAILIGQLRQTLPWRPEEAQGGSELNIHQSVS